MTKKRTARYWIAFFILAVFLVILFVWNVNAGSIHLSVGEILNIIFRHQFLKFIQIKIRMLKLSGELITDLNLIIQVKNDVRFFRYVPTSSSWINKVQTTAILTLVKISSS